LIGVGSGDVAINFEHSWGDGVCVVRYTEEVMRDYVNAPKQSKEDGAAGVPIVPNYFNYS
jgi:hypothetical protein